MYNKNILSFRRVIKTNITNTCGYICHEHHLASERKLRCILTIFNFIVLQIGAYSKKEKRKKLPDFLAPSSEAAAVTDFGHSLRMGFWPGMLLTSSLMALWFIECDLKILWKLPKLWGPTHSFCTCSRNNWKERIKALSVHYKVKLFLWSLPWHSGKWPTCSVWPLTWSFLSSSGLNHLPQCPLSCTTLCVSTKLSDILDSTFLGVSEQQHCHGVASPVLGISKR